MKYIWHIPTETYGFVGIEAESGKELQPEYVRMIYRDMADAFKPQPVNQMPPKEFDEIAEEYLVNGQLPGGADSMEKFSPEQQKVIKIITRIIRKRNQ